MARAAWGDEYYSDFEDEYSDFEEDDTMAAATVGKGGRGGGAEEPEEQDVCMICLEVPERRELTALGCRHIVCRPCICGWLRSRVQARRTRQEDLSCPTCRAELDEAVIRAALEGDEEGRELYSLLQDARAHECALQGSPRSRAMHCPTPDCGIIFVPRDLQEGTCPQCNQRFCARCGHAAHQPLPCEQVHAAVIRETLGAVFSRCPQCGEGCEHVGGCNFMTCRCRAYFCHLCGVILARAEHFSHYQGFHGAAGPFGSVCRNRQRAGEQPHIAAGAAAAAVEQHPPARGPAAQQAAEAPNPNAARAQHEPVQVQAIREALQNGFPLRRVLQDVAAARQFALHLHLHDVAHEALRRALRDRDLPCIRLAVAEARYVGLEAAELPEAEALLDEDARRSASARLRRAVERRDRAALREAIAEGRTAGLEEAELQEAQALLKDERLRKVRASLERAATRKSGAQLYAAILEARKAGLPDDELLAAEAVANRLRSRGK
mmetsp:Transcript_74064/g.239456  ORF Transcript_74064/g.239456 Transcript_74064/m.239456 type:complete len:494 (+) Transcript_74064:128-1609(+)